MDQLSYGDWNDKRYRDGSLGGITRSPAACGLRLHIVERVELFFHREKLASIDILRSSSYSDYAVISPKKEVRIAIDPDVLKLSPDSKPAKNPNTLYRLTAVVRTTSNKKYRSHYRYCYEELLGFIFLDAFDAE